MHITDMLPGDTVFVFARERNILDNRSICEECIVTDIFPTHSCGVPCLFVRDSLGETTVPWQCCLPICMPRIKKEIKS